MNINEEPLTPKQQWVCASAILATLIAFCSVFAYAYWQGLQVQMRQAQAQVIREQRFEDVGLRNKAPQITLGSHGKTLNIQSQQLESDSPDWTITQILPTVENSPQPASPIIACSAFPTPWKVNPKGVVHVPKDAAPGLYKLQYPAGDYIFKVTAPKGKPNQTTPKTTQPMRITQLPVSKAIAH